MPSSTLHERINRVFLACVIEQRTVNVLLYSEAKNREKLARKFGMDKDQRESRNDGLIKYSPIVNRERDEAVQSNNILLKRNYARRKGGHTLPLMRE